MMNILANSSERSFLCSVREMSNPQASLCSSSRCFPLIEISDYACPRVVTYCLAISVLAAFCVTTQLLLLLSVRAHVPYFMTELSLTLLQPERRRGPKGDKN